MKRGKKYLEKSKLVDKANLYDLDAACALIPQVSTAKFDETVDCLLYTSDAADEL